MFEIYTLDNGLRVVTEYIEHVNSVSVGVMVQNALEGSNVDTVEVFSDLMLASKAFQLNSKAIIAADDMWSMINNMR